MTARPLIAAPVYVWFEAEGGMADWPDGACPAELGEPPGNAMANGHVVVSGLAPGGDYPPDWRPTLLGPIPLRHGNRATAAQVKLLRAAGLVVVGPYDGEEPATPEPVGRWNYPMGGGTHVYAIRALPPGEPGNCGRATVLVLAEEGTELTWQKADAEDVELSR